jgi:homoserine/homoserine lactone efflux protein
MSWSTWWAFVALNLVLDLTPGPAVLYVISSALRGGTRNGVGASAGILSANLFYFAISATGLGGNYPRRSFAAISSWMLTSSVG